MTKKAGLLGYPIDHSLSPAIHNAAYEALGLDWSYDLYPCEDAAAFFAFIAEARKHPQDYLGFNVTTPYKCEAYAVCSEHSPSDEAVGNANVLTLVSAAQTAEGRIRGANTDGRGLLAALKRQLDIDAREASVVLCGTGPVALSTLFALIEDVAASVSVVSRDIEKGQALTDGLLARLKTPPPTQLEVIGYGELVSRMELADLLINATTVGMHPGDESVVPPAALRSGLSVYDVIYGHGETALIATARQAGAKACDGVGMLVEQAALTVEIWAQELGYVLTAPRELMYEVAFEQLAKRK